MTRSFVSVTSAAVAVTSLVALPLCVTSFTIPPATSPRHHHYHAVGTSLNLLPNQGSQLVAAYNAAFEKLRKKHGDDDDSSNSLEWSSFQKEEASASSSSSSPKTTTTTPNGAGRAFVSRLFSLPAAIIRPNTPHAVENLDAEAQSHHHAWFTNPLNRFFAANHHDDTDMNSDKRDDVVYYPIVGFRYVKVTNQTSRVVPTTDRASCSLNCGNTHSHKNDEKVVGWYSQACKLGNTFVEDDDCGYCTKPTSETGVADTNTEMRREEESQK